MENQLRYDHKEFKSDFKYLITRLNAWREVSHREFSNVIDSQSTIINKGISNLFGEVSNLQAQLSIITKERNNLLLTVGTLNCEIRKLNENIPSSHIMLDSEASISTDDQETYNNLSQVIDKEEGTKMTNDSKDLEDHIQDAILLSEDVTDQDELNTTQERDRVKLSNEKVKEEAIGLPSL